jgi:hypothetical protein
MNTSWVWFLLFLAYDTCYIGFGCFMQTVFAAGDGNPSAVPPLPTKNRLPFLSSINPRRAAKEAYLHHLQNELESVQRQLYISQNTCTSLRKRWEDQRMDTLRSLITRSHDADAVLDKQKEIDRLQQQLELEIERHGQQVELFNLMSSEMNELKAWKETQEQSKTGILLEYEQLLQESNRKQNDYAEQVELLALKLEAAAFAAKARQLGEEKVERGESNEIYARRAKELRSGLESVRANYSKMLINSLRETTDQEKEGGNEQRRQRESEMDNAIQSAFETALESFENEWAARYETLEKQLNNITAYATTLEAEREAALNSQVQGSKSSKVAKSDRKRGSSSVVESLTQQLREDLSAEMRDNLTVELTEQLTKQLTSTLVDNIEKTYKKKIKQLHKDVKEQRKIVSELKQSQEELTLTQQQTLDAEIGKVKHQYDVEYESKLQQLRLENEEQKQAQKERMRKLVRALLERETRLQEVEQTGEVTESPLRTQVKSLSDRTKIVEDVASAGGRPTKVGRGDPDEVVPALVSRSRKRSATGKVPPVRGNR